MRSTDLWDPTTYPGSFDGTFEHILEIIGCEISKYTSVVDLIALSRTSTTAYHEFARSIINRLAGFAGTCSIGQHIRGSIQLNTRHPIILLSHPILTSELTNNTCPITLTTYTHIYRIDTPIIQYVHGLVEPEKLRDSIGLWCIGSGIRLLYRYDNYEELTAGTYFDFLNRSFGHIEIVGVVVTKSAGYKSTWYKSILYESMRYGGFGNGNQYIEDTIVRWVRRWVPRWFVVGLALYGWMILYIIPQVGYMVLCVAASQYWTQSTMVFRTRHDIAF
jgi:hypothetical protein